MIFMGMKGSLRKAGNIAGGTPVVGVRIPIEQMFLFTAGAGILDRARV